MRRTIPRRLAVTAALVAVLCAMLAPVAQGQEDDPFDTPPLKRFKASMPLPYGVMLDVRQPLMLATEEGYERLPRVGVSGYYDTWQLGFMRADYGYVGRITTRTTGRDTWRGWFVELGLQPVDRYLVAGDAPGDTTVEATSVFLWGIGFGGRLGYSSSVYPTFTWEVTAGSSHIYLELGLGLRVPIARNAVHLGINAFAGFAPSTRPERVSSFSDRDMVGFAGIGVTSTIALGFESEE